MDLFVKIVLGLSTLFHSCHAAPSPECLNMSVWSAVLRDYLFLPEDGMDSRVREWSSFCDSVPLNSNFADTASLLSLWRAQTTFLPLGECSCSKTLSSRLEGVEGIPPTLFVDYPVLGVILLVLAYILRLYHNRQHDGTSYEPTHISYLHQTSHDSDCGPELLR